MKKIYLAAPLFNDAQKNYNTHVAAMLIVRGYDVYLPQEVEDEYRVCDDSHDMFSKHLYELSKCDMLIAICDGADVDSGTSWEIGYIYSEILKGKDKDILLLHTDMRTTDIKYEPPINLMLYYSGTYFNSLHAMLNWLENKKGE